MYHDDCIVKSTLSYLIGGECLEHVAEYLKMGKDGGSWKRITGKTIKTAPFRTGFYKNYTS